VAATRGPRGALQLAPSILSADFGRLDEQLASVDEAADRVHIDVMDGHFVPNLTVGPPVVASLRPCSARFFECHLMLSDPMEFLEPFAEAGADACTVHVEVGGTVELIERARSLSLAVGLACNPETSLDAVEPFVEMVDLVLCMTVHPGFGGQSFIEDVLDKVARLRQLLDSRHLDVDVEVDGGIDLRTAPRAVAAGANVLVCGSAIFGADDPGAAAVAMRTAAGMPARAPRR